MLKWKNPVDYFSSEEKEEKIEQHLIWEPKKDSVNVWTPSLQETSSFCTEEVTRQTYKKYFKAIEESEVEIQLLLQLQHYFSQDRKSVSETQ